MCDSERESKRGCCCDCRVSFVLLCEEDFPPLTEAPCWIPVVAALLSGRTQSSASPVSYPTGRSGQNSGQPVRLIGLVSLPLRDLYVLMERGIEAHLCVCVYIYMTIYIYMKIIF